MGTEINPFPDPPGLSGMRAAVQAATDAEYRALGVTTLGWLAAQLSALKHQDVEVEYDFCGLVPYHLDSWRGSYSEMALGYEHRSHVPHDKRYTVASLLAECKAAVGKVYAGYKGGDYRMDARTCLFIDNYGCYTGKRWICRVTGNEYGATLHTVSEDSTDAT